MREAGFTIVELVVTLSLSALLVLVLARGLAVAHAGGRTARTTTQATALARAALERARGHGYAGLAHVPGATDGDARVVAGAFDPDGDGPLTAEEIVESGDALVDPSVETARASGVAYTIGTYVTWAEDAAKRVTALVSWSEHGRARTTTMSTLVPPSVDNVGAAASVASGEVAGVEVADVAAVEADACGGSASDAPGAFAPDPALSGTGGSATAEVVAGPEARARVEVGSLTVTLPGLTISGAGVVVEATSTTAGMSVAGTGSITVNGTPYVNPAPGLALSVAGYRLLLNDQRLEADGSVSITYLRVDGLGTELAVAWAFVRPAGVLCV